MGLFLLWAWLLGLAGIKRSSHPICLTLWFCCSQTWPDEPMRTFGLLSWWLSLFGFGEPVWVIPTDHRQHSSHGPNPTQLTPLISSVSHVWQEVWRVFLFSPPLTAPHKRHTNSPNTWDTHTLHIHSVQPSLCCLNPNRGPLIQR